MSKLMFQFRKNEYKKTYNILKNDFTKFIFKNTKKKSIFLKLRQTHPKIPDYTCELSSARLQLKSKYESVNVGFD
jgi:hypothetical protein